MPKIVSNARKLRLAYAAGLGRAVPVEEVAKAIGVSRVRLTQIELNKVERYDSEELAALCNFYGVELGELLEHVKEPSEKNGTPGLASTALAV